MNRWDRKGRILGWVAGVALSVNAIGWVLEDVEAVRALGNLQSLLEQAGELSYGAFGLVIWWAIFDSWPPAHRSKRTLFWAGRMISPSGGRLA